MEVRAFKTKLMQVGIKLARGKIMPEDQLRIYRELGAPLSVWEDPHTLVPFLSDTE